MNISLETMEIDVETVRVAPEIEEGNIEYKWKLMNLSKDRVLKLATQMNWRMNEAKMRTGEENALYLIGVQDNGEMGRLNHHELQTSLKNLDRIIEAANARTVSTEIIPTQQGLVAKVLVERNKQLDVEELYLAMLGDTGCGKTTLIQLLNTMKKDNGRGSLRDQALKHPHEIKSGRTSAIHHHLIGFQGDRLINSRINRLTWERIVHRSERIIEIVDLPGNPAFMGTMLFGLMSHPVDHLLLLVDARRMANEMCLTAETRRDLDLCIQLGLRFTVILTKIDQVNQSESRSVLLNLHQYLFERHQYRLQVINNKENMESYLAKYQDQGIHHRIPVIYLSCVTHHHLELLLHLLRRVQRPVLPSTQAADQKEFLINAVLEVPDVGIVVSGVARHGDISVGDRLLIGPMNHKYVDIVVESIHWKQISVSKLPRSANGTLVIRQCASESRDFSVHKKMVMITPGLFENFSRRFLIRLTTLPDWIKEGNQYIVFTGNQIEPITIVSVTKPDESSWLLLVRYSKRKTYRYIRHHDQCIIRDTGADEPTLQVGEILKLHKVLE